MKNNYKFEELEVYCKDINYCEKCWVEFTTLSDEEQNNLKEILKQYKDIYEISRIECVETGRIFKNIFELAKYMNKSIESAKSYIRFHRKFNNFHFRLETD